MKNRITITITDEADQMLDALAREQMRSRGAVIEMLIKAARSGTQVCAPSHLSDTAVALNAAQSDTVVALNAAQSDTPVALDARSKFDDAMLIVPRRFAHPLRGRIHARDRVIHHSQAFRNCKPAFGSSFGPCAHLWLRAAPPLAFGLSVPLLLVSVSLRDAAPNSMFQPQTKGTP